MIKAGIVVSIVGLLVLSSGGLAYAAIINGDFSTGLTGWTTQDVDSSSNMITPSASVSDVGGEAMLATQGVASGITSTALFQDITIPVPAAMLRFDIGFTRGAADMPPVGGSFPDFVQVSYLDASNTNFDRAFIALDMAGAYDPLTLDPVALPSVGGGLFRFTTSLVGLVGRTGVLSFELFDLDDGFFSTARVDNVSIETTSTAVPEPGAWLLLSSGILGLLGLVRWRG